MRGFSFSLAVFFAFGGLAPNSDFSQLTKIGFILHHFSDHSSRSHNEEFDFLDFIALHYFNADNHLDNHKEENHGQLPMHSLGGHFGAWSIINCNQQVLQPAAIFKKRNGFSFLNRIAEGHSVTLFRPPSYA